jgi:Tat protein translocase TatB subunit
MFDIGLPELFVLALVALLVFGPERLPTMASSLAKFVRSIKAQASAATADLASAADIDSMKALGRDLQSISPKNVLGTSLTGNATSAPRPAPSVRVEFDPDAT